MIAAVYARKSTDQNIADEEKSRAWTREAVMTDGTATERRRQKIQERITAGLLPASLAEEEATWIPSPYLAVIGMGPATCRYCDEAIGADEALLIRGTDKCHPDCEEVWRELVTPPLRKRDD